MNRRRVAVYCASSDDIDPAYREAAAEVGRALAERDVGIVFGGGSVGLMGEVSRAAMAAGGEVIGVIPRRLMAREKGHHALTRLFVVEGMQPRKALMIQLADAYLALPGGFGTFEELFEVITLNILEYQDKPIGLLDTKGYYQHLVAFMKHAGAEGFIRPPHRDMVQVSADPVALVEGVLQSCKDRQPMATTAKMS